MSNVILEKNSSIFDRQLKVRTLPIRLRITGNALPANKTHNGEFPEAVVLRTEGKTTDADAVESGISFTAPFDNNAGNCLFGVLIKNSQIGDIDRIIKAEVFDLAGNAMSVAVSLVGANRGITNANNLALQITGTSLALDSENADLLLVVEYIKR